MLEWRGSWNGGGVANGGWTPGRAPRQVRRRQAPPELRENGTGNSWPLPGGRSQQAIYLTLKRNSARRRGFLLQPLDDRIHFLLIPGRKRRTARRIDHRDLFVIRRSGRIDFDWRGIDRCSGRSGEDMRRGGADLAANPQSLDPGSRNAQRKSPVSRAFFTVLNTLSRILQDRHPARLTPAGYSTPGRLWGRWSCRN